MYVGCCYAVEPAASCLVVSPPLSPRPGTGEGWDGMGWEGRGGGESRSDESRQPNCRGSAAAATTCSSRLRPPLNWTAQSTQPKCAQQVFGYSAPTVCPPSPASLPHPRHASPITSRTAAAWIREAGRHACVCAKPGHWVTVRLSEITPSGSVSRRNRNMIRARWFLVLCGGIS